MLRPIMMVCVCALIAACDSSEGGSATVSTGLPASTPLGDLSEADAALLCEAGASTYAQVEALNELMDPCLGEALAAKFSGDGQASTCEAAIVACHAERDADPAARPQEPDEGFSCDPADLVRGFEGCTATVGEFEACSNAMLGALDSLVSAYNCDMSLEQAQSFSENDDLLSPAECDVLETEACQMGDEDGEGE